MPKKRPIVDQVLEDLAREARAHLSPSAAHPQAGTPLQEARNCSRGPDRYRAALAILDAALLKHPGDDILPLVQGPIA